MLGQQSLYIWEIICVAGALKLCDFPFQCLKEPCGPNRRWLHGPGHQLSSDIQYMALPFASMSLLSVWAWFWKINVLKLCVCKLERVDGHIHLVYCTHVHVSQHTCTMCYYSYVRCKAVQHATGQFRECQTLWLWHQRSAGRLSRSHKKCWLCWIHGCKTSPLLSLPLPLSLSLSHSLSLSLSPRSPIQHSLSLIAWAYQPWAHPEGLWCPCWHLESWYLPGWASQRCLTLHRTEVQ